MNLKDYHQYFSLSLDEFLTQHSISQSLVKENVGYEKITGATQVDLPGGEHLFFKDKQLKVIYISDEKLLNNVWRAFKSTTTSAPEKTVRSRAGKTANQFIYARLGITVSVNHDEINFLEIYTPCSVNDYLANVYQEVGPFIR